VNGTMLAAIRRHARSGDTERAWQLFADGGFEGERRNANILSLKGRLIKDRALKAPAGERSALLRAAGDAYLDSAAITPATYPLINAATIALLNDDRPRAETLAHRVLAMLESGGYQAETPYWLGATRAEAWLLLGRIVDARGALAEAVRRAPQAWEDHASTLRHFRLILEKLGEPTDWLRAYQPPSSLHFSGIIHVAPDTGEAAARIGAAIDAVKPGFAFGALAAGADIMVAEILLDRGVDLHIVLPSLTSAFRRDSVGRFGVEWEGRFDAVLAAAGTVEEIGDLDRVSEAGIFMGDEMAMGLAIRHAHVLESSASALRIGAGARLRGRGLDDAWTRQGLAIHAVPLDRDSRHPVEALPAFAREALVAVPYGHAVAAELAAAGARVDRLGSHTIASFPDPVAAVRAALASGRDTNMPLGIAYMAFNPDMPMRDRAEQAVHIAGAVHPGSISVSRSTALALTLEAPELRCENFGHIATPQGDIALSIIASS
jgi:hypothetical protein